MLGDALEVAGEPVGVAGVAEHPRLLQPVRREQPALVELVQVGRALGVRRGRGAHQPGQQRLGHRRGRGGSRRPPPRGRASSGPAAARTPAGARGSSRPRRRARPGRARPSSCPAATAWISRGALICRILPSLPYVSVGCARPSRSCWSAGVVTAVVVGGGVVALGGDDDEVAEPAPAEESFSTTPLADFDADGRWWSPGARSAMPSTTARSPRRWAAIPRTPQPGRTATRSTSATARQDVVHEFGCRYTAADGHDRPGVGVRASGRRRRRPAAGQDAPARPPAARPAPGRLSAPRPWR